MNNSELCLAIEQIYSSIDEELNRCANDSNKISLDLNISDSLNAYLYEIGKYPTLDADAEQKLSKMFCYPNEVKLLLNKELDSIMYHTLNKELLFSLLINSSMYDTIINEILKLYSRIDSNESSICDDLIKYKRISNSLGRSLNKEELLKYFGINSSLISPTEEDRVSNDVIDFIRFKYAYNKFFLCNLKLVIRGAKNYRGQLDMLELISEGNLGLIKAMNRFNPFLGYKFSTYASYCINSYIERAVIKHKSTIRIPDNYFHEIQKYKKAVSKLQQETNKELTIDEISNKLKIPVEKINEYQSNMYRIVSLDEEITPDGKFFLMDVIADEDKLEDKVFLKTLKDEIGVVFDTLSEKEVEIIKMNFGIGKYKDPMSLKEIGQQLSVSPERARILVARCLFKLHRISNTEKVKSLKCYM